MVPSPGPCSGESAEPFGYLGPHWGNLGAEASHALNNLQSKQVVPVSGIFNDLYPMAPLKRKVDKMTAEPKVSSPGTATTAAGCTAHHLHMLSVLLCACLIVLAERKRCEFFTFEVADTTPHGDVGSTARVFCLLRANQVPSVLKQG